MQKVSLQLSDFQGINSCKIKKQIYFITVYYGHVTLKEDEFDIEEVFQLSIAQLKDQATSQSIL